MVSANDLSGQSEKEILDGLLENGPRRSKAEDLLFKKFDYFIKEGGRKYSLTTDEAFDAYSDAVLSAIHKIIQNAFEGRSSLKTWLFQIFHNKCVDLLRKKTTNKNSVHHTIEISDRLQSMSDNSRNILQSIMDKSDQQLLLNRLREIGEQCRKLLLLWADGYPDKEIMQQLEYKSSDVVKTSRLRCLDKLKQLYKNITS